MTSYKSIAPSSQNCQPQQPLTGGSFTHVTATALPSPYHSWLDVGLTPDLWPSLNGSAVFWDGEPVTGWPHCGLEDWGSSLGLCVLIRRQWRQAARRIKPAHSEGHAGGRDTRWGQQGHRRLPRPRSNSLWDQVSLPDLQSRETPLYPLNPFYLSQL